MERVHESYWSFDRRNRPTLTALLARVTGSRAVAEDLAQDALMAASRDWQRVSAREAPDLWVRRIALNRASSWLDRRRLEARCQHLLALPGAQPAEDPLPDAPLWDAIRALTPNRRSALVLRIIEDRSYFDIAAIIGCSELSARQHVSRALAELRMTVEHDRHV